MTRAELISMAEQRGFPFITARDIVNRVIASNKSTDFPIQDILSMELDIQSFIFQKFERKKVIRDTVILKRKNNISDIEKRLKLEINTFINRRK